MLTVVAFSCVVAVCALAARPDGRRDVSSAGHSRTMTEIVLSQLSAPRP
ncbi:hypothetical protein J2X65_000175 [Ancylobacter sp. 3268]|nr:hypothetical protein [Ancylobacter sp. 3268]MDR6950832.1 hypothetical protein [Ancylobacter sp. 3268]